MQDVEAGTWSESERALTPDVRRRLARLEKLAWWLDRSVPIGRWRIGIDPILGLMPGIGDTLGAGLSLYIVYEAARLGAPGGLLLRMLGNVLAETLVGVVPVIGDLFDAAWKANTRNMRLIHQHHGPQWQPRSFRRLGLILLTLVFLLIAGLVALVWWLVKTLMPLLPF